MIFAGFFALFTIATSIVPRLSSEPRAARFALIVCLVDIDPFTLSVARASALDATLVTAIVLAMLSNTVAKGAYFGTLAAPVRKQHSSLRHLGAAPHPHRLPLRPFFQPSILAWKSHSNGVRKFPRQPAIACSASRFKASWRSVPHPGGSMKSTPHSA
jgi:hypothetical protein